MPRLRSDKKSQLFIQALARTKGRAQLREHVDEWADERDSLAAYLPAVHRTDTGAPAFPPPHVARLFLPTLENDSIGNVAIVAPPGSAKTNSLIAACGWWLGRDPGQHIGYFSATDRQAYRRSVAIRDTLDHNGVYRSIFPEVEADKAKGWAEFEWYLRRTDTADKDASLMAAGVGSAIQGSRLDRVVFDDIASPANMATPYRREKVTEWIEKDVMTRLPPWGRGVMLQTRWAEGDPVDWARDQGWRMIYLPAIVDGQSYWPGRFPINQLSCPDGAHGYAVEPDEWDRELSDEKPCWIMRDAASGRILRQDYCIQKRFGTRYLNLVYLGIVMADESAIVKRQWWKRYRTIPAEATRGAHFVDLAHEEGKANDYTVIATVLTDGTNFYWENVRRFKAEFPEVVRMLQDIRAHRALPIVIENQANSKPLIQTLRRLVPGVIAVDLAGRSKQARLESEVHYIEAGNCYLPENAIWVSDFIEEHALFPAGAHDDQVDTTSAALLRLGQRRRLRAL